MVKKRTRNLPVHSPLESEAICRHIRKALDEGAVKRALVNVVWDVCQDCQADSKDNDDEEEGDRREDEVVWLCLKCGHRGCGRYSERQHALNHYNTPRSEPHCLVLNVCDWNVWCYMCDNQVDCEVSGRLRQLVEYLKKKSKPTNRAANAVKPDQEICNSGNTKETEIEEATENTNRVTERKEAANTNNESKEIAVRGLSNLGNTCFFNAVMQNLSQTPTLRELLNEVRQPGKTVSVSMPDHSEASLREVTVEQQPGPMTLAMWQFVTEMQETKKGVVTPKDLFSQVCKKAAQFRGYQQQDSQELLRYLLDGMRGEEIQRVSSAIAKTLQDKEKMDEDDVKKIIKDYEKRRAIPNFVDRLFGGELTSTIMCETCHTVSLVREPFLDLSLPVLDDLPAKKNNNKAPKVVYEKDADDDSYVKERNDLPSGGSKHLQKKAKKQAKKQAKSQRRQQKIQGKTVIMGDHNESHPDDEEDLPDNNTLDNNTEQHEEAATDGPALGNDGKVDVEKTEGNVEELEDNKEASGENLDHEDAGRCEDAQGSSPRNLNNIDGNSQCRENNCESPRETSRGLEASDNSEENTGNSEGPEDTLYESDIPQDDSSVSQLTANINRLNLSSSVLEPNDIEIEIIDEPPCAQVYEVVNEDPNTAFCTLSDRKELQLDECSVFSCLYQFTRKENLAGNNQLLCNTCTKRQTKAVKNNIKGDTKFVYTNAKKQMLVSSPPPILTLHLKRFHQNGFHLHKINKHIKFPEVIDLAPFCTAKCKNLSDGERRLLYSLYGVIEHSGTMRSGHYTAYVKSRVQNPKLGELVLRGLLPEVSNSEPSRGHWFHISDSHVQAVPITKVLSSQAYLLFYERIL